MNQCFEKLEEIINLKYNQQDKLEIIKNHNNLYILGVDFLNLSREDNTYRLKYIILACECFNKIVSSVDNREYLLLNSHLTCKIPKNIYMQSFFYLGNYLKTIIEEIVADKLKLLRLNNSNRKTQIDLTLTKFEESIFYKSLSCFIGILQISFEDTDSIKQITSIYSQLVFFSQPNHEICCKLLNESLIYDSTNPNIHYNLGHVYQKMNRLENSLIHYKIALGFLDLNSKETKLNCYNGIASIYRSIKKWPECLYFLLKAHYILNDDPDINNQLGVAYTEMRETEKAEKHYLLAIENYKKTFISTDPTFLLAEIYLNYGHLHSYNGDNLKSIECYNNSLKVVNKFSLPFCNKLMNLCYIFDQLPDDNKMYIKNQHLLINKLYTKNPTPFIFNENFYNTKLINIGIISGDFVDHPVSFFISTYLENFDNTRFSLTCYSECVIDTTLFNKNITFKIIKNMSQENASKLIYNDNIHILLDLTGLTAFNRMDVFAFKPAPIQITYIGYPNTTGLYEMDYRFTDSTCDNIDVSQPFYTEKLIFFDKCFLCYNPYGITKNKFTLPVLTESPRFKNNSQLVIGCFNRINKITDTVILEFNKIMRAYPNIKFLFKTKALINTHIKNNFLNKFDKSHRNNIIIIDCTLSHKEHLETYNQVDIAIDTMVYSGTTTTTEALTAGVPVFSWHDTKWWFHASNVSASILKNSGFDFYICNSTQDIIEKINILLNKPIEFWKDFKINNRHKFLNSNVCSKDNYMKNIQDIFIQLFLKKKFPKT